MCGLKFDWKYVIRLVQFDYILELSITQNAYSTFEQSNMIGGWFSMVDRKCKFYNTKSTKNIETKETEFLTESSIRCFLFDTDQYAGKNQIRCAER